MLVAATKGKINGLEKKKKGNRSTYKNNIFSIKLITKVVTREFQSRCSRAKQRQRNEPKKCAASCFLANDTYSRCRRHLALPDFMIILFE